MCDPAMRTLGLYDGEQPAPPLPPGVPPGATIVNLEETKSADEGEVSASTRSFRHGKRRHAHKSPIPGELSAGELFAGELSSGELSARFCSGGAGPRPACPRLAGSKAPPLPAAAL